MLISYEHLLLNRAEQDVGQLVGSFLNPFIALGALYVVKWKPLNLPVWLRGLLAIRHALWFFVASGFVNVILNPMLALLALLNRNHSPVLLILVFSGPILLGLVGAACLISEAFDLAGRRKARTEELLAFKLIK